MLLNRFREGYVLTRNPLYPGKVTRYELTPLSERDKNELAEGVGRIAGKYGIRIQTCGTNGTYSAYGIESSGCATLNILGEANGCEFRDIRHKGMREGCHCAKSRDIGAYDTCPNSCRYCYANKNMDRVKANYKRHDPAAPLLLGYPEPGDTVTQGAWKSFLSSTAVQVTLFDRQTDEPSSE